MNAIVDAYSKREQLRRYYLPQQGIQILFIAEAPPVDNNRFFYAVDVAKHDYLFLELIRSIYQDASCAVARDLRKRKLEYLRRFQADGFYLLDASEEPILDQNKKAAALQSGLPYLLKKLHLLVGAKSRILLIGTAVYENCADAIKRDGFQILNGGPICFPSSGQQTKFRSQMSDLRGIF